MYSLVMMMAMTGAPESPGFYFHGNCNGCCGGYYAASCSGGYYSACFGYGGSSCFGGCCGGCCGGCYGGPGCYGCTGYCFGSGPSNYTYASSALGCCGGCWGHGHSFGGCSGCFGGCCGGGCYGGYAPTGGYGGCTGCYGGVPYAVVPYPYSIPPVTALAKTEEKKPEDKKDGSSLTPTRATVVVALPADAKLYADDRAMNLSSASRTFVTPTLEAGRTYQYTLRAEYTRAGEMVKTSRRVTVRAGETTRVDFEESAELTASLTVTVPADAKLTVDGVANTMTGAERVFRTPALEKDREYAYTMKAEVVRDGKVVSQVQKVQFRAGGKVTVDFADLEPALAAKK